MPKTTEQNLIVRIGKPEAEVTIIKYYARGPTLLKLTTDRNEASRGLSATAGLLVLHLLNGEELSILMDRHSAILLRKVRNK